LVELLEILVFQQAEIRTVGVSHEVRVMEGYACRLVVALCLDHRDLETRLDLSANTNHLTAESERFHI